MHSDLSPDISGLSADAFQELERLLAEEGLDAVVAGSIAPRDRLSFPFFFDPNFFARVRLIDLPGDDAPPDDAAERWDKTSVHMFEGTYGEYLLNKVGKVFPELAERSSARGPGVGEAAVGQAAGGPAAPGAEG